MKISETKAELWANLEMVRGELASLREHHERTRRFLNSSGFEKLGPRPAGMPLLNEAIDEAFEAQRVVAGRDYQVVSIAQTIRDVVAEVQRLRAELHAEPRDAAPQIAALDARLAAEQAKTAALEARAQHAEAELAAKSKLLGEWCADWQQEPKTRLAQATMVAMRGRG